MNTIRRMLLFSIIIACFFQLAALVKDTSIKAQGLEVENVVLISSDSAGVPGNSASGDNLTASTDGVAVSASADGYRIAFASNASNLVPDDTNSTLDIFVKDVQNNITTRISTNETGVQANNHSWSPSSSADGRYVAFVSSANNLIPEDTNSRQDIFMKDTQSGSITRISTNSLGVDANDYSSNPAISADGRYVAFDSNASNLVYNDTNRQSDIFIKDTQTGTTTRASANAAGNQNGNMSRRPAISADGRYVVYYNISQDKQTWLRDMQTGASMRVDTDSAGNPGHFDNLFEGRPSITADGKYVSFNSSAFDLVDGDTNETNDIFVKSIESGSLLRVSTNSGGQQANASSSFSSISSDGRFVVFSSYASNLVLGDTNGVQDTFVKDLLSGATSRISTDASGNQGNGASGFPILTADAMYSIFSSNASNLISGDSNGATDVMRVSLGIPTTTNHYFPWYDSVGGKTWVLMAQPSSGSPAAQNNTFDVTIKNMGSPVMESLNPGGFMNVPRGSTQTVFQPGKMGGPLKVAAYSGDGLVSERSLFGNSFEEIWGTSLDDLDSHYWWPIYDSASPGMKNWILVANPPEAGENISARVRVHGTSINEVRNLSPGESWTPIYPGNFGGPVEVTAWKQGGTEGYDARNVIASQRVLSNGAFNEIPGIAATRLSTGYMWTWYDNTGGSNWITLSNPDPNSTIWGGILVGNPDHPVFVAGDWIGPLQTRSFREPGAGGPVFAFGFHEYSQVPDANIVATQRVLWGPSFGEISGTSLYEIRNSTSNWTWYDQKEPGVTNWVLISNPNESQIYVEIRIAGQTAWGDVVDPYSNKTPTFPGFLGGPVEAEAWTSETDSNGNQLKQNPEVVFASQRVVWNGYFNEIVGKGM